MKILYYLPIKTKFINKWEFYKPDIDVLREQAEIKIVYNFFKFLYNIFFYDVVYCIWWHRSCLPIIVSKIFKKKIVCTGAIHFKDKSGEQTWFKSSILYKLTNLVALNLTDFNIFVSKQQMFQFKKYLKIKNGYLLKLKINKSLNSKINEKFPKKISKNIKLVLTSILWQTKSSYKRKGLFQTLEALAMLKKKGVKFEFNIVGQSGNGINLLKKKIDQNNLKKEINIHLDLSQPKKIILLKKTHLYMQPSFSEAFSYAVLEASAFNVLSIINQETAQKEITSRFGYKVSSITKENIYNTIIKYLKLKDKDEKIMLEKLKNHINKHYSFDKHKEEMKILLRLIDSKR